MLKRFLILIACALPTVAYSQNSSVRNCVEYSLEDITEKYYNAQENLGAPLDTTEFLQKTQGCYKIDVGNLHIVLKDNDDPDDPDCTKYTYLGKFSHYICFGVSYYESYTTLVINLSNGTINEMYGEIYLSPNKEYIVSASQMPGQEPFTNDIKIWSVHYNMLKLVVDIEITDWWEPENIKWIDNHTILFKKLSYNTDKPAWVKLSFLHKE